jgi:hypothetical protein
VVALHFRKQFKVLLSLHWFRLWLPVRAAPPRGAGPGVSAGASKPIGQDQAQGPVRGWPIRGERPEMCWPLPLIPVAPEIMLGCIGVMFSAPGRMWVQ